MAGPGSAEVYGNVVSGNGVAGVGAADEWGKGIEIFGAGADGNKVVGNYVGTVKTPGRSSTCSRRPRCCS